MHLRPWRPQAPPPTGAPPLHPPHTLTPSQLRVYALEKEVNFRWIARLLSSPSTRVLTRSDALPSAEQRELAALGQFAELAHGSADPRFVWRNLTKLVSKGFPLEGYDALPGSELLAVLRGKAAGPQAYVAYRPTERQVVLAVSGTSCIAQALRDMDARMVRYPVVGGGTVEAEAECRVHAGFWRMFLGLKDGALAELANALSSLDISELILTGHSLGAAHSLLFALELLQSVMQPPDSDASDSNQVFRLPPGLTIKVVGFGSPRIGNTALASYYQKLVSDYQGRYGEDSFQEYSVKGYNDGVPCLPPKALGFRHFTASPIYLSHGQLFRIPPTENEHSVFPVKVDDDAPPPEYPRGGHNYYNNRDMERSLRHLGWLDIVTCGEEGWEERYQRYLEKESQKRH